MRIIQALPSLVFGDGISNEALQIDRLLKEAGKTTHIYAERIGPGVDGRVASGMDALPKLDKEDVLLYHLSIGNGIYQRLSQLSCHLVFRYHNVTPAKYFAGYDPEAERNCRDGLWQVRRMSGLPELVLADSGYNADHLKSLGYRCPMEVLPILVDLKDYAAEPDGRILERYRDGRTNFLFVGRVVPNKKQEDLIRAFYAYHKWINPQSRLILAGNDARVARYRQELGEYCDLLGLTGEDVVFTGSVPFAELLAYYRAADVFLCMSEHEGFCIPLLEVMSFGLPIIAYDAAAVGETLGDAGLLLKTKDVKTWAEAMERVRQDEGLRARMARKETERLKDFAFEACRDKLLDALGRISREA